MCKPKMMPLIACWLLMTGLATGQILPPDPIDPIGPVDPIGPIDPIGPVDPILDPTPVIPPPGGTIGPPINPVQPPLVGGFTPVAPTQPPPLCGPVTIPALALCVAGLTLVRIRPRIAKGK
jgi:hypothetical protein